MKRFGWLTVAVGLLLTCGCLDNQAQHKLLQDLDKVNERLNNINRRFDRLQMESQVLKHQVEEQKATIADLYREIESLRASMTVAERQKTAASGQPAPPVAGDDQDIRQDPGQQQSVGQFLQQMRPR